MSRATAPSRAVRVVAFRTLFHRQSLALICVMH